MKDATFDGKRPRRIRYGDLGFRPENVVSLTERRKKIEEDALVWYCRCGSRTFTVFSDAALQCSKCGLKSKQWMQSLDDK